MQNKEWLRVLKEEDWGLRADLSQEYHAQKKVLKM